MTSDQPKKLKDRAEDDIRPSVTQGWVPVLIGALVNKEARRWLPRVLLSPICWALGHAAQTTVLPDGSTAYDCQLCRMRIFVSAGTKLTAGLAKLGNLRTDGSAEGGEPAQIEEL